MLLSLMLSCTKEVAILKTALLTSEPFSSLFVLPRFYWIPRIITDSVAAAAARRTENILLKSLWFPPPVSVLKFCLSFNLFQMCMKRCKTRRASAEVQIWPCSFCHYKGRANIKWTLTSSNLILCWPTANNSSPSPNNVLAVFHFVLREQLLWMLKKGGDAGTPLPFMDPPSKSLESMFSVPSSS